MKFDSTSSCQSNKHSAWVKSFRDRVRCMNCCDSDGSSTIAFRATVTRLTRIAFENQNIAVFLKLF